MERASRADISASAPCDCVCFAVGPSWALSSILRLSPLDITYCTPFPHYDNQSKMSPGAGWEPKHLLSRTMNIEEGIRYSNHSELRGTKCTREDISSPLTSFNISLSPHKDRMQEISSTSILLVRDLRLRELKSQARVHIAGERRSWVLNSNLPLPLPSTVQGVTQKAGRR